ncbi:HAMP domain-containing histidine kinase [Paenibacillus apiarius]|uniref:histidine kinase n=2 Tax=Paenibacillus apiarius TaxID=46240 RepID=A0ABT4E4H5_9BACL|nr:HAMP domain-containing sensor histidine kinase [Paenibacillus apiarius]MCY9513868.1 HAMP domain-containing histidine kinase [Paenibacillus apiarius]MCY9523413.1 HAMP domain-containing histidine kinase [Paenibacillus apiarius]MCY9554511.1 HAMP domain-containing histidine kinase [Paenibacillus apiarius]MCY9561633.1 HAMP domain-containing histidine kinase [Paenibacillus apiarius]MCY9687178.1 HAMP domain-containing histidine kinase [Paenibacillus apiarius]
MLRNREIQILLLVMCSISLAAIVAGAFISSVAAVLVFITSALLIGSSLLFTRWRYREIEKLSIYLRQISSGNYSLDVRDNQEGELSILKNDIYKVTLMLSEQRSLLQHDKIQLTDAISDISHQLKTPLTSMTVMADLLSDPELPLAKRMEFTRNIRIQLERIDWLVSSLLKLSKMDAKTIQFKKDQITVKMLIQKALEPVLIPMDIKEITVSIKGEDNVTFLGDLNWTAEAVINILKNGVEHTQAGGVIAISFSENALFTEIIIEDSGKGIPKEDLPYVFKRFYKGKNASEGSIGIGLSMAHSIIASQNGVIDIANEREKGTQFRIKFYKQVI